MAWASPSDDVNSVTEDLRVFSPDVSSLGGRVWHTRHWVVGGNVTVHRVHGCSLLFGGEVTAPWQMSGTLKSGQICLHKVSSMNLPPLTSNRTHRNRRPRGGERDRFKVLKATSNESTHRKRRGPQNLSERLLTAQRKIIQSLGRLRLKPWPRRERIKDKCPPPLMPTIL